MSVKSVLILEDDPERVHQFYIDFFRDQLVVVNNANDAIEILKAKKFDLICLDHDLGGEVYADSESPNTGFQVTKAIPGSLNSDTTVIIHSYNHIAAKRMEMLLVEDELFTGDVYASPFGRWSRASLWRETEPE